MVRCLSTADFPLSSPQRRYSPTTSLTARTMSSGVKGKPPVALLRAHIPHIAPVCCWKKMLSCSCDGRGDRMCRGGHADSSSGDRGDREAPGVDISKSGAVKVRAWTTRARWQRILSQLRPSSISGMPTCFHNILSIVELAALATGMMCGGSGCNGWLDPWLWQLWC